MNTTAIALGALAGFTIFLGLPLALLKNISPRAQRFLTSMSNGILLFLLIEITSRVLENVEDLALSSFAGYPMWNQTLLFSALFAAGLLVGLLGLVGFEKIFIRRSQGAELTPAQNARRLSMMIALGIGLHNFSEGLAIGQAYSWGNTQLAWLLVTGFALHNATEGFGIAGPLSGQPVSWRFLGAMGLLGGGPTLLGSLIGSFWTIKTLEVFFLSMASGSILYVVGELLQQGRHRKGGLTPAVGLLAGFFLAFATELFIHYASGGVQGS